MNCCPKCFTHDFIKKIIKKLPSLKSGRCSYCSTDNKQLTCKPSDLTDLFLPIMDLYESSTTGDFLNKRLQEDWKMFSTEIPSYRQKKLIADIITDKNILTQRYISRYSTDTAYIKTWEIFEKELLHKNRFFPKTDIKREQLKELISYLVMKREYNPRYLFRARVNRNMKLYEINEMGKPPVDKARDGRANPKGIPYFYAANDYETAIAEVRPYKSEMVCIARYRLSKDVRLIDLREPKLTICPVGMDEDNLSLLYKEHMPFLNHLSYLLSIPVLPHKKDLDYLPTQYLCELIKDQKYDGIIFRSSLGKGDNYVIFNDELLKGEKVEMYSVEETIIKSAKVKISK